MKKIRDMTGALFFSKEHPQISGYIVIDGEHFEIAGWRPSLIRGEITARKKVDDHERSGTGAGERDPA